MKVPLKAMFARNFAGMNAVLTGIPISINHEDDSTIRWCGVTFVQVSAWEEEVKFHSRQRPLKLLVTINR